MVETPCIDDAQLKPEDFELVGELPSTCARLELRCLYLASLGRPDNVVHNHFHHFLDVGHDYKFKVLIITDKLVQRFQSILLL